MTSPQRQPLIVCLTASARTKGNSASLARLLAEEATRRGASVESFNLAHLSFRGCQGCLACKKTRDTCALQDDLTEVLDLVSRGDVLVLATPIYFGEVAGQLKMFIDRCFSFYLPDYRQNPSPSRLSPGKTLVFIQTQGVDDPARYDEVFARYEYFFQRFGFTQTHHLVAAGVREEGEVLAREDTKKRIQCLVDHLMRDHGAKD